MARSWDFSLNTVYRFTLTVNPRSSSGTPLRNLIYHATSSLSSRRRAYMHRSELFSSLIAHPRSTSLLPKKALALMGTRKIRGSSTSMG